MLKTEKLKFKQYVTAIVKRLVILTVILYCFSALDLMYRWENLILFALLLKVVLSVLFFIYLLRAVGDILREIFHGSRYLSIFPDIKEMLLTEIFREVKNGKKQIRNNNRHEDVYMGELKTENTITKSIIKK